MGTLDPIHSFINVFNFKSSSFFIVCVYLPTLWDVAQFPLSTISITEAKLSVTSGTCTTTFSSCPQEPFPVMMVPHWCGICAAVAARKFLPTLSIFFTCVPLKALCFTTVLLHPD